MGTWASHILLLPKLRVIAGLGSTSGNRTLASPKPLHISLSLVSLAANRDAAHRSPPHHRVVAIGPSSGHRIRRLVVAQAFWLPQDLPYLATTSFFVQCISSSVLLVSSSLDSVIFPSNSMKPSSHKSCFSLIVLEILHTETHPLCLPVKPLWFSQAPWSSPTGAGGCHHLESGKFSWFYSLLIGYIPNTNQLTCHYEPTIARA